MESLEKHINPSLFSGWNRSTPRQKTRALREIITHPEIPHIRGWYPFIITEENGDENIILYVDSVQEHYKDKVISLDTGLVIDNNVQNWHIETASDMSRALCLVQSKFGLVLDLVANAHSYR